MQTTIYLPFGEWVNILDPQYGVPSGEVLKIQNQGKSVLRLSDKATQPDLTTDSITKVAVLDFYENSAGDAGAWAFGHGDLMVRWG